MKYLQDFREVSKLILTIDFSQQLYAQLDYEVYKVVIHNLKNEPINLRSFLIKLA
jgi:hypothetical protein